jgi:cell division protein FtsI (penicillin-binding protein 3)
VNHAARSQLDIKLPAWRSRLLLAGLLLWFVALAARAFYLQGLNNDFLKQKGESRYSRVIEISATRRQVQAGSDRTGAR